jgi:hypothetical protein
MESAQKLTGQLKLVQRSNARTRSDDLQQWSGIRRSLGKRTVWVEDEYRTSSLEVGKLREEIKMRRRKQFLGRPLGDHT